MKLILNGVLETISTRQDGTIKFTIGTQEIGSDDAGRLFTFRGKYLKCLISDTNITAVEESIIDEEIVKDGKKIKSQAQRLRAVLYRLWEQEKSNLEFDAFYKERTDLIIEQIKNRLE